MKSKAIGVIFLVSVMLVKLAEASGNQEGSKIGMRSSAILAQEIEKLPEVEIDSAWENDPVRYKTEIVNRLELKSLDSLAPFRRTVWFNQPSRVTGKAKNFVIVISLATGKSIRFDGDDLYLALKGEKDFSESQKKHLSEILKGS